MLKFTKDHEWIRLEPDGSAVIGITDYAQQQLGDIVFVELPAIGKTLKQGDAAAVVESVKAASDIYAPVDGRVLAVNEKLVADPALANTTPLAEGWFFAVTLADEAQLDGLLDETGYATFCREQA